LLVAGINPFSFFVPIDAGLSLYIDTPKQTMYDWGKKSPDFSHTLGKVKATQEYALVNKALSTLDKLC